MANSKRLDGIDRIADQDIVVMECGFRANENPLIMSRTWLRLLSCVCLGGYLLANTHASFALERLARGQLPTKAKSEPVRTKEEPATKPSKCKHCCKASENQSEEQSPCKSDQPTQPCDDPSCPCCPGDNDGKHCPCPGGCAMCSVAKAPLLTPIATALDTAVWTGECQVDVAFDYVSPLQRGLIRPPRV